MSDPIEISKKYRDLGESEDFISYDRLAGGMSAVGNGSPDNLKDGQAEAGEGSKADEILRQAREERDRILAEEEELKKKAYQEGFASGQEEGHRQGRNEFAEKIDAATDLIKELAGAREQLMEQYEAEILDLIKVMADRLVQREIRENKQVIRDVRNFSIVPGKLQFF